MLKLSAGKTLALLGYTATDPAEVGCVAVAEDAEGRVWTLDPDGAFWRTVGFGVALRADVIELLDYQHAPTPCVGCGHQDVIEGCQCIGDVRHNLHPCPCSVATNSAIIVAALRHHREHAP